MTSTTTRRRTTRLFAAARLDETPSGEIFAILDDGRNTTCHGELWMCRLEHTLCRQRRTYLQPASQCLPSCLRAPEPAPCSRYQRLDRGSARRPAGARSFRRRLRRRYGRATWFRRRAGISGATMTPTRTSSRLRAGPVPYIADVGAARVGAAQAEKFETYFSTSPIGGEYLDTKLRRLQVWER